MAEGSRCEVAVAPARAAAAPLPLPLRPSLPSSLADTRCSVEAAVAADPASSGRRKMMNSSGPGSGCAGPTAPAACWRPPSACPQAAPKRSTSNPCVINAMHSLSICYFGGLLPSVEPCSPPAVISPARNSSNIHQSFLYEQFTVTTVQDAGSF